MVWGSVSWWYPMMPWVPCWTGCNWRHSIPPTARPEPGCRCSIAIKIEENISVPCWTECYWRHWIPTTGRPELRCRCLSMLKIEENISVSCWMEYNWRHLIPLTGRPELGCRCSIALKTEEGENQLVFIFIWWVSNSFNIVWHNKTRHKKMFYYHT